MIVSLSRCDILHCSSRKLLLITATIWSVFKVSAVRSVNLVCGYRSVTLHCSHLGCCWSPQNLRGPLLFWIFYRSLQLLIRKGPGSGRLIDTGHLTDNTQFDRVPRQENPGRRTRVRIRLVLWINLLSLWAGFAHGELWLETLIYFPAIVWHFFYYIVCPTRCFLWITNKQLI